MIDLQQFCHVGPGRAKLSRPFHRGVHTFATNGHILVRVPHRAHETADFNEGVDVRLMEWKLVRAGKLSPLPAVSLPAPEKCGQCLGSGRVRECSGCGGDGCADCDGCGEQPTHAGDLAGETCTICDGRKAVWGSRDLVYLTERLAIAPRYYVLLASLPAIEVDLSVDAIAAMPAGSDWLDAALPFSFAGGDGLLMAMRMPLSPRSDAPCFVPRPHFEVAA